MLRTRYPRQTITLTSLFLVTSTLAACDVVLGIEPGVSWCQGKRSGEALPQQIEGDCRLVVCDGNGGTKFEAVPNDVPPDDGNPCTVEVCHGSVPAQETPDSAPCYSGPDATKNVGRCKPGLVHCSNGVPLEMGCPGQIIPESETCANELDDDCDGLVNEEGVGCECVPGTTRPCYSGPAVTRDVGACHAGQQSCKPDGLGYGPCVGEVLPQADTCDAKAADEDCDGVPTCETLMVKTLAPAMGTAGLYAFAVDPTGNIVIFGYYTEKWNIGGSTVLPKPNGVGYFVAKLDGSGNVLWARTLGNPNYLEGTTVTIAPDGAIILTGLVGIYNGGEAPDVDIDNVKLSGGGAPVFGFVLNLNGSNGSVMWGHTTTGGQFAAPISAAVDLTGAVVVVGDYGGSIDWGGGALPGAYGGFIAKLSANGTYDWSKRVSGLTTSVRIDAVNRINLLGQFSNSIDLGGGPLMSAGGGDIFENQLYGNGGYSGSHSFGGPGNDFGLWAIAPSGNRWIAGVADGPISFGGNVLTPSDQEDVFVAVLSSGLEHQYSKMFPGKSHQFISAVAASNDGRAAILGRFQGDIDIEGTKLTAQSNQDIFVAMYEKNYSLRWARSFGLPGSNILASGLVYDPSGAIWIGGTFSKTVDFGQGSVTSNGDSIFLVKLAP